MDRKPLEANPNSAQAGTDVAISNERLGNFALQQLGDAAKAKTHFEALAAIWRRFYEVNPESSQFARGLTVPLLRLHTIHRQLGDETQAVSHLAACFAILDGFAREGRPMDRQMRVLHQQLLPMFGNAG